jgi:hypothetical protein
VSVPPKQFGLTNYDQCELKARVPDNLQFHDIQSDSDLKIDIGGTHKRVDFISLPLLVEK